MADLCRDDNAPEPGPRVPIIRVAAKETLHCTILSYHIQGYWTHWTGDRSQPHWLEEGQCPGCRAGSPKRWKGYVFCQIHERKTTGFVELTPGAAVTLGEQLETPSLMRGTMVMLSRSQKRNGRLNVTVLATRAPLDKLAPAIDVEPTLRALWGIPPLLKVRKEEKEVI